MVVTPCHCSNGKLETSNAWILMRNHQHTSGVNKTMCHHNWKWEREPEKKRHLHQMDRGKAPHVWNCAKLMSPGFPQEPSNRTTKSVIIPITPRATRPSRWMALQILEAHQLVHQMGKNNFKRTLVAFGEILSQLASHALRTREHSTCDGHQHAAPQS